MSCRERCSLLILSGYVFEMMLPRIAILCNTLPLSADLRICQ